MWQQDVARALSQHEAAHAVCGIYKLGKKENFLIINLVCFKFHFYKMIIDSKKLKHWHPAKCMNTISSFSKNICCHIHQSDLGCFTTGFFFLVIVKFQKTQFQTKRLECCKYFLKVEKWTNSMRKQVSQVLKEKQCWRALEAMARKLWGNFEVCSSIAKRLLWAGLTLLCRPSSKSYQI